MKNILTDANIFLEFFLDQEKGESCKNFIDKISSGEINVIISIFSVDSIIISLIKHKVVLEKALSFLRGLESSGLRVYYPDVKDRMESLNWIQKYKLDYEDALTLQSALSSGCKEIMSFDKHFDKVKEIKRIEP